MMFSILFVCQRSNYPKYVSGCHAHQGSQRNGSILQQSQRENNFTHTTSKYKAMKMRQSFLHTFSFLFMILWSSVWYEVLCSDLGEGGLGDLAQILAQLSGGNDCRFKCPRGYKPLANPKHKATSNGCGSMGIQLDTSHSPGFTQCCDTHDLCYDTCNNDRNQCDEDFKSCLDNVCLLEGLGNRQSEEQIKACKTGSELMYSGTVTLGCMSYKEAQRNACLCNGRQLTKKEVEELEQSEKEEL